MPEPQCGALEPGVVVMVEAAVDGDAGDEAASGRDRGLGPLHFASLLLPVEVSVPANQRALNVPIGPRGNGTKGRPHIGAYHAGSDEAKNQVLSSVDAITLYPPSEAR